MHGVSITIRAMGLNRAKFGEGPDETSQGLRALEVSAVRCVLGLVLLSGVIGCGDASNAEMRTPATPEIDAGPYDDYFEGGGVPNQTASVWSFAMCFLGEMKTVPPMGSTSRPHESIGRSDFLRSCGHH